MDFWRAARWLTSAFTWCSGFWGLLGFWLFNLGIPVTAAGLFAGATSLARAGAAAVALATYVFVGTILNVFRK